MFYEVGYLAGFAACIVLAILIYRVRRSQLSLLMMVMTSLLSLWMFFEGVSFLIVNKQTIYFYQKIKYIPIALITPVLLSMTLLYVFSNQKNRKVTFALFYVIPLLSIVSVLTNRIPYTFFDHARVAFDGDVVLFQYTPRIGYQIHTLYSYVLIVSSNILLLFKVFKTSKIYRKQGVFIFLGSFLSMAINVIFITHVIENNVIDTTPFFVLLTCCIYYWGIYLLPQNKLGPRARIMVVEQMSDMIVVVDSNFIITDINQAASSFLQMYLNEKNEMGILKFAYTGVLLDRILAKGNMSQERINSFKAGDIEEVSVESANKRYYFKVKRSEIHDGEMQSLGYLFLFLDITKLRETVIELTKSNQTLQVASQVINSAHEAIIVTDKDNKIISVNDSVIKMTGYSEVELLGEDPKIMKSDYHDVLFYRDMWRDIEEKDSWEGEIWDRRKNGEIYPKWLSITVLKNESGKVTRYIGISTDISKMKYAEEQMHELAYYDRLTSIPNRALFLDRIKTALSRARRTGLYLALMNIDIDGFKDINETYGHSVGDQVLIEFTKRIKMRIRETDTVSRVGSNEFTLVLEELRKPDLIEVVASDLIKCTLEPFCINDHEIMLAISIGIAVAPSDDQFEEGLIRKANMAMHHVKEFGGNHYIFSSDEIERRKRRVYQLGIQLKEAIKEKQFKLFLQPQVKLVDGDVELVGAEALIRWFDHKDTFIPPDQFIGVAENNGTIHQIGIWVFEEVLRINDRLLSEGIKTNLSLNVSIKQFESSLFIDTVKALMNGGMNHQADLTVEITESLFFDNLEKGIKDLEALKALGLKIALDDFGTGFSSMSYLNRLPIDYVKIDKSFIDEIEPDSNKNLAHMILSMARTLELKSVAEGVETYEQAISLTEGGCDILQGYYYSKPVPVDQFIEYVKSL